ncbi:2-phosphosulfolactate phosphatase [Carboxylicivirga sp. N1Y90]|uniref:2-phosphosulfolactate phosphatase n=1 Tax=Carboxylicivirga fragile TaxID=3417571 RepID=UPI003D350F41|nr:2-phosphosulfolactate phosphatase [Marinilabiliaceae bacterium N1Y90]
MKIDVVLTAQQVEKEQVQGKTVVVIDVLRATSVMLTAFKFGVSDIIPVLTPDEAIALKLKRGGNVILGGERNAELISGFDFGNSPLSYMHHGIKGKTLVMTTSNGTLAINNSLSAKELLIGAFSNLSALVKYLNGKDDVVLVCSGTNGKFTIEDALCAGKIIEGLKAISNNIDLSDAALMLHQMASVSHQELISIASGGYHYNVLKEKGYEADLDYCFQIDQVPILAIWEGDSIKCTTGTNDLL